MIKRMLLKVSSPVFLAYYLKKHGGIWNLKRHLQCQARSSGLLLYLYDEYFAWYGSYVGLQSQFAGEPCFPHGPYGVFISGGSKIGRNPVIFQHTTIGSDSLPGSGDEGSPTIGDNVYIGTGARIIGNIQVGDNCRIGANAVVYDDMPPHSVAVQSPTRVIRKSRLDNRYFTVRNGHWVYFDNGHWVEDSEKEL